DEARRNASAAGFGAILGSDMHRPAVIGAKSRQSVGKSGPLLRRDGLLDQGEFADRETVRGRFLDLHHPFAQPLTGQIPDPEMAIGIVAALAEQRMRGPGAAGAANIGVVAGAAIA